MAVRPDYDIGVLDLTSGSSDFTTSGSSLQTAAVQAGDAIIAPSGHVLIIATITGQNSGTLFLPCPAAAAGTDLPLRIRFQPDGSRYQGAVRNVIDLLSSGNLEALAALVGSAGLVPIFTGPGTIDLADPATFGIQDPNGSLGKLASLTLAANKAITTDGSGNAQQSNLGIKGQELLAAPDIYAARYAMSISAYIAPFLSSAEGDAARAAILTPPRPSPTTGRGYFNVLHTASGAPAQLPDGGTYAYWFFGYEAASGQIRNGFVGGIAPGGATLSSAVAGWIWSGMYWNLT